MTTLPPFVSTTLKQMGISSLTEVQKATLPLAFSGKDLLVQAQTGSGKTLAFSLLIAQQLKQAQGPGVKALVLCPTRELADQVAKVLRQACRQLPNTKVLTLVGGVSMGPQIGSLRHGADVIVGTPGRILAHLRQGRIELDRLATWVLDEADRLLDMGFLPDIETLSQAMNKNRKTYLFSATYNKDIKQVAEQMTQDLAEIQVEHQDKPDIQQRFFSITNSDQKEALQAVLDHINPPQVLVFCNTKDQCDELNQYLNQRGYSSQALHGDMDQKERDLVWVKFKHQSCRILIATDVAARGLDIQGLPAVMNYGLCRDPHNYQHRIGRTGRAGEPGLAISLVKDSEAYKLAGICDHYDLEFKCEDWEDLTPSTPIHTPTMRTLEIDAGKKLKIRPGDVLGALTGEVGLTASDVGSIDIFPFVTYVAVVKNKATKALTNLQKGKLKGRKVKVRLHR